MHRGIAPKLGRLARLAGLVTLVAVSLFVWEAPAWAQVETAGKLAKGTADFLKQRFESEAERLFLDGLARNICKNKNKEARYFPKFCKFYYEFGQDAVYSSYGSLVAALRQDVHEIPLNLLEQLGKDDGGKAWTMGFELLKHLNGKLRTGQNSAALIAGFADDETVQEGCGSVSDGAARKESPFCGLIVFGLFAELHQIFQVLAADAGRDKGIDSKELLAEFCRVVVQKKYDPVRMMFKTRFSGCKDIVDGNNPPKVSAARAKFVAYKLEIRRLIDRAKQVEELLDKTSGSIRSVVAVIEYSALSISVLDSFGALPAGTKASPKYKKFRGYLDMANELVILISDKKFQEALFRLSEQLAGPEGSDKDKEAQRLKRYLPIIFDLAGAESAEDVTKVLDQVASPVGAWRLKQDSGYFGVNAFVGYAGGSEHLPHTKDDDTNAFSGVFAPIGFDWTWPDDDNKGSHGLFVSLFDLGNMLSIREGGDTNAGNVEDQPGEDPKNLVSLGAYYHFTLAERTGLVWGVGASVSPAGRAFTEQGSGGAEDVPVWRATLFFAFDIPIFPIRTNRR